MMISYPSTWPFAHRYQICQWENSTKESSLSVFFHETHAATSVALQQKVNIFCGHGPVPPDTAGSAGEQRCFLSLTRAPVAQHGTHPLHVEPTVLLELLQLYRGDVQRKSAWSLAVDCERRPRLINTGFSSSCINALTTASPTTVADRFGWDGRSPGDQEPLVSYLMFLFLSSKYIKNYSKYPK